MSAEKLAREAARWQAQALDDFGAADTRAEIESAMRDAKRVIAACERGLAD